MSLFAIIKSFESFFLVSFFSKVVPIILVYKVEI